MRARSKPARLQADTDAANDERATHAQISARVSRSAEADIRSPSVAQGASAPLARGLDIHAKLTFMLLDRLIESSTRPGYPRPPGGQGADGAGQVAAPDNDEETGGAQDAGCRARLSIADLKRRDAVEREQARCGGNDRAEGVKAVQARLAIRCRPCSSQSRYRGALLSRRCEGDAFPARRSRNPPEARRTWLRGRNFDAAHRGGRFDGNRMTTAPPPTCLPSRMGPLGRCAGSRRIISVVAKRSTPPTGTGSRRKGRGVRRCGRDSRHASPRRQRAFAHRPPRTAQRRRQRAGAPLPP